MSMSIEPPGPTDLREDLALYRTELANERTLLAYTRTSLALVAAGVGILQFFTAPGAIASGIAALVGGAAVLLVGTFRFLHVRRDLRTMRR